MKAKPMTVTAMATLSERMAARAPSASPRAEQAGESTQRLDCNQSASQNAPMLGRIRSKANAAMPG